MAKESAVRKRLRLIPLGGLGEIGKNMMALEYGENLLVIDCGLMFPQSEMFGIDIVIPDMRYVIQRKEQLHAILITHGHEDHIGALPYLVRQVHAPVYATKLTRGLIEVKLKEYDIKEARLHTITTKDTLTLGPFKVEFFAVCHSIPDGVGLAIHTPVGTLVHSGDFKFDQTPVDGRLTDFAKLAELGKQGVLVLLSDSTNAESEGYTPSEQKIKEAFDQLFPKAKGRIIVATFASNISRVQQVVDTAEKYNRRVGVIGRSMVNNLRIAKTLGYIQPPRGGFLEAEKISGLAPEKVAIVCTGSQGEPTSALVRMANHEHPHLDLVPGDTVIVSATPIPGNEELIHRTLDNLFRLGANVYYYQLAEVHVSGHASREEQKMLINLVKPRFFVPIHGEYRHLAMHAQLAQELGLPRENILVAENGQVLEFTPTSGRVGGRVGGGPVYVDGLGVGDVGQVVLRDRHLLSKDGFLIAVVTIDGQSGRLLSGPDIISRGFVYMRDSEALMEEAKRKVIAALKKGGKRAAVSQKIKDVLGQFLYQETKRRPMILPVVMEV